VMWAQGVDSIHLNVKFAGRLDAPVTVLNVDNEEVTMNETHVTFSGIGRQKPKRYVIDLELHAAIDTNASSWAFGSVGTVRFVLKKAIEKRWERLTASNESVKNHRVWWEKQEQVQKEDDKKKKAKEEAESREREREREKQREAEAAEREAKEAEERRVKREASMELRAVQVPLLDAAVAAVGNVAEHEVDASQVELTVQDQLATPRQGALDAIAKLMAEVGQASNETATANAESLIDAIISLRSAGYQELTKDARDDAVASVNAWLQSHVEPEPEPEPKPKEPKAKGKKKAKKKATKK